jgi:NADPH:quinone reductase-like Zn-dependent oxidoreductase
MGYKRVVITKFGGPEVLKMIEETQLPEPKSGEVRVKVLVTSAAFTDAWIRIGKLVDLEMYGTASKAKHELIKRLGATPIDYKSEDFVERIRSLTGDGVDAAFDAIGGDNFKRSFRALRGGGKLVAYGFYNTTQGKGGSIPLDFVRLQLWNVLPNGRSAAFYLISAMREKQANWFSEDLTQLFDLLAQNKIKPIIEARMPFAEAKRAHELIEQAEVQGKIVLTVAETPA